MASTHTQTYTHTVPSNSQGGWSTAKRSDAILTHVGVSPTNRINCLRISGGHSGGWGEQAMANTHTPYPS